MRFWYFPVRRCESHSRNIQLLALILILAVMHQFVDDTKILYSRNSSKEINRCMNHDLKLIVHWLRVSRISLNVDKTETVLFEPKRKKITKKYELLNKQIKDNMQNSIYG